MSSKTIELDGSFGEGGGQILRTALSLSLLTGKAFRLYNIRANRPKPGLRPQHVMCVRAAGTIGQATVTGAAEGSRDLTFEPGEIVPGKYHFAIGTAGATALVLQTLYLPLALRGKETSEVAVTGGTHVMAAPCFHFLQSTWTGYLQAIGMKIKLAMLRPGFYPRGGGTIRGIIHPCADLLGLRLKTAKEPTTVRGISIVSNLPDHIAKRQARRAEHRLRSAAPGLKVRFKQESWSAGPGTVLALELDTEPAPSLFFALGERGKKAERVADEAVDQLLEYLESGLPAVDAHSADQLVLPLSLAAGGSSFAVSKVTNHLTTNIAAIHHFLDRNILCEGEEGKAGKVIVE